jgi:hypothetical protein
MLRLVGGGAVQDAEADVATGPHRGVITTGTLALRADIATFERPQLVVSGSVILMSVRWSGPWLAEWSGGVR